MGGRKERYLKAKITDPFQVYDNINLGRRIDPLWPDELWRSRGGRNSWKDWIPEEGMEGTIVHKWVPCHREVLKRSHVDKTILLLKIDTRYVPIVESAVKILEPETEQQSEQPASKPEESSKESSSLPPILPSQEASASALQDPLNVSLAAPQSLNVNSATSVSGTDLDGAKVSTENSGNGMG